MQTTKATAMTLTNSKTTKDLFLLEKRRKEVGLEAVEATTTTIAKSTRRAGATKEIFFPVKREEGGWPMYVHTTTKLVPTTQRF